MKWWHLLAVLVLLCFDPIPCNTTRRLPSRPELLMLSGGLQKQLLSAEPWKLDILVLD